MKARIKKVRKEYGAEMAAVAIAAVVVVGYAYWGSLLVG